jgi:hypothetical protein
LTRLSEGLADQDYCLKMEQEVPVTAQYLIDRMSDVVSSIQPLTSDQTASSSTITMRRMFCWSSTRVSLTDSSLRMTLYLHELRTTFRVPRGTTLILQPLLDLTLQGGGHAIINALFDHIRQFDDVTVMWETQAEHLLTHDDGSISGVKVRKSDGRLTKVLGKKVMLACGGFEGNREMYVHQNPVVGVCRPFVGWQNTSAPEPNISN